jgi:hypothetical protein
MSDYIIHHNGVDRPATADEIKEIEEREKNAEPLSVAHAKREQARAAVLAKLGLTADEAAALLG